MARDNTPTVTIRVDRKTRQVSINIQNFHGMPATCLDRVDILIERELYKYNQAARQEAAESSRLSMATDNV